MYSMAGVLCLLLFVTTMDGKLVLSLALLSLAVSPIQSFPNGGPAQACSDLRPGPDHGGVPQTTPSPYELDVDMFEDLSSNDGIVVPVTYSYTPGRTYDRKWLTRGV